MFGLTLKALVAFSLLFGSGQSGLVHRRMAKETSSPIAIFGKENQSDATAPRNDKIPVTIIHEPEQPLKISASAFSTSLSESAAEVTSSPEGTGALIQQDKVVSDIEHLAIPDEDVTLLQPDPTAPPLLLESDPLTETNPSSLLTELSGPVVTSNSIKALPPLLLSGSDTEDSADGQNILQRQGTQDTPTQSTTPQNFVQQLIQNSPIGQFLSQLTGGQQQQQQPQPQQGQQQADEAVTPAPTLPGFLNPGAAITSAQQAVQNAAQSVVNSTTQAFQGLQQFATNLGTQFQNTFSTLAGQQNQLTTADSTTTRPPGPIQSIVSSFVNPPNNQAADSTAASPGQQQQGQQQGPLQGILSFFQGGVNRPQAGNIPTTVPPKKEPLTPTTAATPTTIDDKIDPEQHDEILDQVDAAGEQEPDATNEVRSSAEVELTVGDPSSDEGQAEDMIVVNDDANQQAVKA